ncbi:hypothetical protein EYV94_09070 [Puteibacter caeruleilacunae]|nr:hypothetical protein EYV94_09070 [Puteibacter caeruleilacunae]
MIRFIKIALVACGIIAFGCVDAQVAHTLKADIKKNQQLENTDDLLKDYFKLAHATDLMERGKPVFYSGDSLDAIQFPVGGIGTGCIQFDGKAVPRYWQIFNNMTHDFIPNSFFACRVANGKNVRVRALQTEGVAGLDPMAKVRVRGEFPFLTYHFSNDLKIGVEMTVFNPFVPTNMKKSGIPAVFYRFKLTNNTANDVEVDLLGVQQNAVGFTQVEKVTKGDSFAERFQMCLDRKLVQGNECKYYGGNINEINSLKGATVLSMIGNRDQQDEHFGQMALIAMDANSKVNGVATLDVDEAIQQFAKKGQVKGKSKSAVSESGETWTGAINSNLSLKAGESKEIQMALVWYFPNGLNGGHMPNWDAWGKGKWQGEGNYYANHWKNINELCEYVVENHAELSDETQKFHDTFYNTNIPYWLANRLSSQLVIMQSRTIFHDKKGYVGLWEGAGAGDGSCAGNCNHVWHYAQAHARLFPEMGRKIREQSYFYLKDDGQIPYRQPAAGPAFDGQCGDILATYREYLLCEDNGWMKKQYPKVKKAIGYLINTFDKDQDGWLSGHMHTTYDCGMSGNPSFLTSLYLATLEAGAKMAQVCGDTEQQAIWSSIAEQSQKKQDDQLWNGAYYIQQPDKEHHASDYEGGCHSDQLLGQWWADMIGLGSMYPDYRILSAAESVLKYNFKSNLKSHLQQPRKFAKPDEPAFIVTSWPNNDRPGYAPGYSDEIWPTYEYTIGAQLIKYGRLQDAFAILSSGPKRYDGRLRKGYKTNNGWGNFGFSGNPFGDDECGQFYSRSLANWAVLLALQGYHYDGPKQLISFNPKWKPENHCSFFSTAKGWGNFWQRRTDAVQENKLRMEYGNVKLSEIHLNVVSGKVIKGIDVKVDDSAVRYTKKLTGDQLTLTFDSRKIQEGDEMNIRITY